MITAILIVSLLGLAAVAWSDPTVRTTVRAALAAATTMLPRPARRHRGRHRGDRPVRAWRLALTSPLTVVTA